MYVCVWVCVRLWLVCDRVLAHSSACLMRPSPHLNAHRSHTIHTTYLNVHSHKHTFTCQKFHRSHRKVFVISLDLQQQRQPIDVGNFSNELDLWDVFSRQPGQSDSVRKRVKLLLFLLGSMMANTIRVCKIETSPNEILFSFASLSHKIDLIVCNCMSINGHFCKIWK